MCACNQLGILIVSVFPAELDVVTPPLDGTILPGITRASILELAAAHPSRTTLPGLPSSVVLHACERTMSIHQLFEWSAEGRLLEAFSVGTAAVVAAVGRDTVRKNRVVIYSGP